MCLLKPVRIFKLCLQFVLILSYLVRNDVDYKFTNWLIILYQLICVQWRNQSSYFGVRGKSNVDLYSASLRTPLAGSDMDHTVLPANKTMSAFTRKHFSDGATTHMHIANAWVQLSTHLSTPREWMAELAMLADIQQTVYPEEVTRQLRVMVQARESSPVIKRHRATF